MPGVKRRMIFFPQQKFQIIYCDPPWHYDDKALAGKRGASSKYDLMSDDDLKLLPVPQIADNNCILFMWATFPKLPIAIQVMESWGFEYKTVAFVWVKKNMNGTDFIGMGSWVRSNAEIVLLGTKGKPKRVDAGISQIVYSVPKKHSEKPDQVRQKIVKLCGNLPRIELFARTKVHGWSVFGNDNNLNLQPLEVFTIG